MQRDELNRYLDDLLEVSRYRDYCPNGLQVEARSEIRLIISGVTASLDLIQAAQADGADAILVHTAISGKARINALPARAVRALLCSWRMRSTSGDIFEQQVHLAHESGVAFAAAGYRATEKYGVQALGAHLAAQFRLEHRFLDLPNPV